MASPLRSLKAWESLCASIEAVASYTAKTELCAKHFDRLRAEAPECVFVCIKLLLAKEDARVYRLRDKQWIKLLAVLLHIRDDSDMLGHLELGDISETARHVRAIGLPLSLVVSLVNPFIGVCSSGRHLGRLRRRAVSACSNWMRGWINSPP